MKVKPSFGFEFCVTGGGYARLSQMDAHTGEEAIVLLSPSEIQILLSEMQALLDDVESWWQPVEEEGM